MISILTATMPDRGRLFAEAAQSVAAQTMSPAAWYVGYDHENSGPSTILNRLAASVDTEWLFRLDDDDILEPDHFDTLAPYLTDEADIVYSWCRVEGTLAKTAFQVEFDRQRLKYDNFIPSAACIRTSLFKQLGGYRQYEDIKHRTRHEDWDFWLRAENEGANFVCVPIVTWTYRLGDWSHRSL
jgi:hypothetical protein